MPGTTAYLLDSCMYLSSNTSVLAPVTGFTAPVGELYAGARSDWTQLDAGITRSIPVLGATSCNRPPVFNQDLGDRVGAEGAVVSLSAAATDPDGDPLTYSATGLPTGLGINPSTGLIAGVIGAGAASGSPYQVQVSVGDGPAVDATDTFTWTVTPPAGGGAGGGGGAALDTIPPETVIAVGPRGPGNDPTPVFEFGANEDGSTFQCQMDTGGFQPCTSPFTSAPLEDGKHDFEVQAIDPFGNVDPTPATSAFRVDTVAPDVAITGHPAKKETRRRPSFSFASDDGKATFSCRMDKGRWAQCSSPLRTDRLDLGRHVFKVRALDPAGNESVIEAFRFRVMRRR
jgi:hypothetical protein